MFKRSSGKYNTDFSMKTIYKYYTEKSKDPVSQNDFRNIIIDYFELLMPKLIDGTISEIRFPARLGTFMIKVKEYEINLTKEGDIDKRYLIPNWGETLKLWKKQYPHLTADEISKIPSKKIIYHLNEHTDRRRFLWYWDKTTSNVPYQSYYRMDVTRKWDRYLASYNKEHFVNYFKYIK